MHGGAAPQVRAAAAERQLDARLERLVGQLEGERCDNPLEALAQLAGEILAWKDLVRQRVSELQDLRYASNGPVGEQIRGEVILFERALDRCVKVLGMIARLDLDTRLAKITEEQAINLVRAVEVGITAAGLSGASAERARRAVAGELRLLA